MRMSTLLFGEGATGGSHFHDAAAETDGGATSSR